MDNVIYELTLEGKKKLETELEELKTVKRADNIKALQEARAQGDLSENADYSAAREEQSRIESRILEIENILKNSTVLTVADDNKVSVGKTVEVLYINSKIQKKYYVVSTIEADPFSGKISTDSPLGSALLTHKVNDKVLFTTESGKEQTVKILSIE